MILRAPVLISTVTGQAGAELDKLDLGRFQRHPAERSRPAILLPRPCQSVGPELVRWTISFARAKAPGRSASPFLKISTTVDAVVRTVISIPHRSAATRTDSRSLASRITGAHEVRALRSGGEHPCGQF